MNRPKMDNADASIERTPANNRKNSGQIVIAWMHFFCFEWVVLVEHIALSVSPSRCSTARRGWFIMQKIKSCTFFLYFTRLILTLPDFGLPLSFYFAVTLFFSLLHSPSLYQYISVSLSFLSVQFICMSNRHMHAVKLRKKATAEYYNVENGHKLHLIIEIIISMKCCKLVISKLTKNRNKTTPFIQIMRLM